MARLRTTADAFNAIAEPKRREIIDLLAQEGELPVNDIARLVGLAQPQASKHLRVLREVGLVGVRGSGQRRLYRLIDDGLKPISKWVKPYERFWGERLDRLEDLLSELQRDRKDDLDETM
jgi:DNA-binding transcriptional ArsR family regulator